jgi:hypothetical protein
MPAPGSNSSKQIVHSASSTQSFSEAVYRNIPVRRKGDRCRLEEPKTTAAWACSRAAIRPSGVLGTGAGNGGSSEGGEA